MHLEELILVCRSRSKDSTFDTGRICTTVNSILGDLSQQAQDELSIGPQEIPLTVMSQAKDQQVGAPQLALLEFAWQHMTLPCSSCRLDEAEGCGMDAPFLPSCSPGISYQHPTHATSSL